VTADLLHVAGARRRAVLVGEGERLARLYRALGSVRSGIEYEFVGAISPRATEDGLPVLGSLDALPRVLAERDVDELIVTDTGIAEKPLLELVEHAHRRGVKARVGPSPTDAP